MTAPSGAEPRLLTGLLLAVDRVHVPARIRICIALSAIIIGWSAGSAWIITHRDVPARPDTWPLDVLYCSLVMCHFVNALLGPQPSGRTVLRWAAFVLVVHLALAVGLLLMVVPASHRLIVALDALLIGPGIGVLYAGIGIVALVSVFAVTLGIAATSDLVARAFRNGPQSPLERVRNLSLAACVLGAVLAFICISITPTPLAMSDGIGGRGSGVLVACYLFLQAFGITETRPGWYPTCINILFVLSLVLIAQGLLRLIWSRRSR